MMSSHRRWSHPQEGRLDNDESKACKMIQFMENLSMMGAMVILITNGSGPMSLDALFQRKQGAKS